MKEIRLFLLKSRFVDVLGKLENLDGLCKQ